MTDKENIKNIVELFIAWNGETEAIDVANIDSAVDFISDSLHEETASEDLEEASIEWDRKASFKPFYMKLDCNGKPNGVKQNITTHKDSFKAGAEWQKQKDLEDSFKSDLTMPNKFYEKGRYDMKQEMMKDAVEAEVMYPASSSTLQIRYKLPKNTKLKYGDKVKIIIVKEE